MNDRKNTKPDPERPWLERLVQPEKRPASLAEAERELAELREIQAHREWVIDGLRAHIENIDADLERAHQRVRGLEQHGANLEASEKGLSEHIANLEADKAEREAYLEEVEAHVVNLERRVQRRSVRFEAEGIFPSSRFARLESLFRLGDRIRESRPDLIRRFPKDRAADYWYWLLWHGPKCHPELSDRLYPEPDAFLRARVVGDEMGSEQYARSGLVNAWTVDGCLREAGFDPLSGGRVLDFGAGCGRILQYFSLYSGNCQLVGTDVDSEAMQWCRDELDFASFETLPSHPPSAFPDQHFDAIYAFSVFSHLPETLHRAWLEDLFRIAKPGAAVVLTVQGRHVAQAVLEGSWSGAFPSAQALRRALPRLEKSGFAFFPYEKLTFSEAENRRLGETLDPDQYGSTFILEPYVRANWCDLFELVDYSVSPDDWQDFVVLRRRPAVAAPD